MRNDRNNTKRILVFESYPFFSGAQRVSLNFCKVLKANGFNITLLLADDPNNIHHQMFGPYTDEILTVKTSDKLKQYGNDGRWFKLSTFFDSFFKGLLPFYTECFKVFRKGRFDALYFCDPRGAVMMLLPSIFFKGKRVCYLQGKNKLRPFIARLIFLTFTDHLLCPSTDVLESLPASRKKTVLNYGVDFSQYSHVVTSKVMDEITQILPEHLNSRVKLLYAGLIRPLKGLHHLIYSVKTVKDSLGEGNMPVLFILGNPKNEAEMSFMNHLRGFCTENDLDKYVYWMGWKDNVLEWMKNCHYFIFPTINKEINDFGGFDKVIESTEGSPVVLIESSLCGLFALASKVTGVNETITDNHNGIMYNPDEPDALSVNLINMLKTRPKFIDFPNRERFSPENFANKIMHLFQEQPA